MYTLHVGHFDLAHLYEGFTKAKYNKNICKKTHKKKTFSTHEGYKTILFSSEEGCTVTLKKEWQGKSGKGN